MVTLPEGPMISGTNDTVMVQVAPGGSVVTQSSDSMKLPEEATPVMTRSSVPLLLSVELCGALGDTVGVIGNVSRDGVKVAAGPLTGVVGVVGVFAVVEPVDELP